MNLAITHMYPCKLQSILPSYLDQGSSWVWSALPGIYTSLIPSLDQDHLLSNPYRFIPTISLYYSDTPTISLHKIIN